MVELRCKRAFNTSLDIRGKSAEPQDSSDIRKRFQLQVDQRVHLKQTLQKNTSLFNMVIFNIYTTFRNLMALDKLSYFKSGESINAKSRSVDSFKESMKYYLTHCK